MLTVSHFASGDPSTVPHSYKDFWLAQVYALATLPAHFLFSMNAASVRHETIKLLILSSEKRNSLDYGFYSLIFT